MTINLLMVGYGKMGQALTQKFDNKIKLSIVDPNYQNANQYNDNSTNFYINKQQINAQPNVILFAVKPQILKQILLEYHDLIKQVDFIISIAAGISIQKITEIIQHPTAIIRAMPNITASIGLGSTLLCHNKLITEQHAITCQNIFLYTGAIHWLEENLINTGTAISGSGPAYIFYLAEIMTNIAKDMDLDDLTAKNLVNETILGAASMLSLGTHPAHLRDSVTSTGGTTEAALKVLTHEENGIEKIFREAIQQAKITSEKLNK